MVPKPPRAMPRLENPSCFDSWAILLRIRILRFPELQIFKGRRKRLSGERAVEGELLGEKHKSQTPTNPDPNTPEPWISSPPKFRNPKSRNDIPNPRSLNPKYLHQKTLNCRSLKPRPEAIAALDPKRRRLGSRRACDLFLPRSA